MLVVDDVSSVLADDCSERPLFIQMLIFKSTSKQHSREVLARLQPSLWVVLMAPDGGQGKFGNTNKLTNLRLYKILSIFY